jgi:hypothetical protein
MNSDYLKLNTTDLKKALILVVGTFCVFISASLDSGSLPKLAELQSLAVKSLVPGLVYIGKNLLTNSQGEMLKTE